MRINMEQMGTSEDGTKSIYAVEAVSINGNRVIVDLATDNVGTGHMPSSVHKDGGHVLEMNVYADDASDCVSGYDESGVVGDVAYLNFMKELAAYVDMKIDKAAA